MRTKDSYLIHKCLSGDTAAFGVLVDRYKESIYALAYTKLHNFHDAQDVTQEVFIKAYEKLSTLRQWDNFYAWLYSITSNTCKMWLRARRNRPEREYLEEQDLEAIEKPTTKSHYEELVHEMVGEALVQLPEIYCQVLTLYYFGDMNTREIAQFLRVSKNTIESRLKRARLILRKEMITMMSATFDEMKLQPGFTFRVVEAIKQTKIQAPPSKMTLPFSISAAAGVIVLLLSLSLPYSPLYPVERLIGSALPSQTQANDDGIIAVDAIEITKMVSLSSEMDNGDFGKKRLPEPTNFAGAGKWERKADMPTDRLALRTAMVAEKIYAIGGIGDNWNDGPTLSTVEEYDPVADGWTKKADMPTKRSKLAVTVVNEEIYAIGGFDAQIKVLSVVEKYNPIMDTWTKEVDMPIPTAGHAASVVHGRIYVIGGGGNGRAIFPTVVEYDPANRIWTKKADMPTARADLKTAVVNGKIYAIGGGDGNQQQYPTVEEYDPVADKWTKKADMPTARSTFSMSVVNGKIYAIGGWPRFLPTVEEYDPVADKWTRKNDMPTGRQNMAASAVDGKIYVIGGATDGRGVAIPLVEELDLGLISEVPQSVNPQDKLSTTWGEVKREE